MTGAKNVPIEPFIIRPVTAPAAPKPKGPEMSPEDAAAFFRRLFGSRILDRRRRGDGQANDQG